jgi:hypothetical protein
MAYKLEGRLLEVCNCNIACPCWLGEDPDPGFCYSAEGYHFDKGQIDGIDVAGLTVGVLSDVPGNILAGNHRVVLVIDDSASPEQEQALSDLFRGKKDGPVAELSQLWGELVAVERGKILFDVKEGQGHLEIGAYIQADLAPYRGPTGEPTVWINTPYTTVPGNPAYVAKASHYRNNNPKLGIDIELKDHNAIQCDFRFEHQ